MRPWRCVLLAAAGVAMLAGCTSESGQGSQSVGPDGSALSEAPGQPSAVGSAGSDVPGSPGPSSTLPPVSFATPLPEAAEVVSTLAVPFGWSESEAACVASQLPDEVLDAARSDALSPGSDPWKQLVALGERCWQAASWAPEMVVATSESIGRPLGESEASCVQAYWTALPSEDVEAVTAEALAPSRNDVAHRVIGALNEECGL